MSNFFVNEGRINKIKTICLPQKGKEETYWDAGRPIQYQVDGDNPKVEGQEFF